MIFQSYGHERKKYYKQHMNDISIIIYKELSEQKKWNIIWDIQDNNIYYPHAEKLNILYQQINNTEIAKKESFIEVLWLMLSRTEDKLNNHVSWYYINWAASVLFFWFYKIGHLDKGLFHLKECKSALTIIKPFLALFKKNISIFNNNDLWIILEIISSNDLYEIDLLAQNIDELKDLIIDLRYKKLERKLEWIDTEISSDKIKVNEYLKDFWFDNKYNITLNKIDKFISIEDYDDTFTPGWVIWIFREFFDNFYIDLAKKICNLNWAEEVPENKNCKKLICHSVKYIQHEFDLSEDDTKLLWAYLWITNWKWAHKLLSEKKYFRLTRNIGIEIALLMLSKLEDLKQKKENS